MESRTQSIFSLHMGVLDSCIILVTQVVICQNHLPINRISLVVAVAALPIGQPHHTVCLCFGVTRLT